MIAAGLAPAPAKPIMTFGAVCRASMRAVMRNYLSSLSGLTMRNFKGTAAVVFLKSIRVHLAAGSKVVKIFTHLRVIIGIT